jgi:hypothetical protein
VFPTNEKVTKREIKMALHRSNFCIQIVLFWFCCCAYLASQPGSSSFANYSKATEPLPGTRWQSRGMAKIIINNGVVHLSIDDPRDEAALVVLPATASDGWDLSKWRVLAVNVKNLSRVRQQRLVLTVTEKSDAAHPHAVTAGVGLNPGETRTLRLLLPHRWLYGAPNGVPGVRNIDTAHTAKLEFSLQWPFERPHKGLLDCEISHLRVEGRLDGVNATDPKSYVPFIDRFGQFVHGDWPAKIHSDADLRARFSQETQELADATRPTSWDRFGGWKDGPQLKATGNFRTEKYQGKWYFVDPDGRLFLSQGIDVLSASNEAIKVPDDKAGWFEELPVGAHAYNAVDHNLRIKYGSSNYEHEYFERLARRLEVWGINSIGDWSSPKLMELDRTPYTLQLTDYDARMPRIEGSKLKFYDVFDPRYIERMRTLVATAAVQRPIVARSLTDPMCIGYFIDNELNFGNRGKLVLVDGILQSPSSQAAKKEFVRTLEEKYKDIDQLNTAWEAKYTSWDALLLSTSVPASDAYKADAADFFRRVVDQYFRLAHDAVKLAAPNRLYLGARFISTDAVRPDLYEACAKYCDVLSVNIYAHSAAGFPDEDFPDVPVMVTEFQFGILQRGMFSPSLCQAGADADDRGLAYTRFLEGVLKHPKMVGAQWFQYRDQPLTGRGDGEAYQIGFVDVVDTPYPEITAAARAIADRMYTAVSTSAK